MPSVIPITITQLDWKRLLSQALADLSRNLASGLDTTGLKPGSFPALISILESMSGREGQPYKAVREADSALRHFSFGFLISGDPDELHRFIILTANHLSFTLAKEQRLLVASGNLENWKSLIQRFGDNDEILQACKVYLNQAGLAELFG